MLTGHCAGTSVNRGDSDTERPLSESRKYQLRIAIGLAWFRSSECSKLAVERCVPYPDGPRSALLQDAQAFAAGQVVPRTGDDRPLPEGLRILQECRARAI